MKNREIAVIGATGKTGSRVLTLLENMGVSARPLGRNTDMPFDWQDRSNWEQALNGVDSAYVTYFPDLAVPQAEEDISALMEVAKKLGLKHVVLLSGRGEEGAQRAEQVVINSGLEWNIVRASWFMQNFSESFMLEGILAGNLVLPHPKATEPFIDVDDISEVVVKALVTRDFRNELLEVTGPELLSFSDCVQSIAQAADRAIEFSTLPLDVYLDAARQQGLPDDIAWLMGELFDQVLDGRNEQTTRTVERVLGRPARCFEDYVAANVQTGVWSA